MNAPEYDGFPQAGQLLRTATTDFRAITELIPGLTEPVKLHLIPLVQQARALAMFQNYSDFDDNGIPVRITDKTTGQVFNARFADPRGNKVSILLEETMAYRNSLTLIDWAGYWYITPALARMLKQRVLDPQDQFVIEGNINALNLAQSRKLIAEQRSGVYTWKQGVGPFSQDWQDVMKAAKAVSVLISP